MMYVVTAVKDIYEEETGVEFAGVFDEETKAYAAKVEVENWLVNEGFEDFKVFVLPVEVNNLNWYDIEKKI